MHSQNLFSDTTVLAWQAGAPLTLAACTDRILLDQQQHMIACRVIDSAKVQSLFHISCLEFNLVTLCLGFCNAKTVCKS